MGVLFIILILLIPIAWFAGLFGVFYVVGRRLYLRQPGLAALATLLLIVFVSPPAINALTRARVNELLRAKVTNVDAAIGSRTLGIVRQMSEVKCWEGCQSILLNRQADRVILAKFENSIEPDWSTPQASFVLGDCSDPADLPIRDALAPINVAKATGLCIHREDDRPLSDAQHTFMSGYFTRKHLIGPSMEMTTARYYVRDGREQRLVDHQTELSAKYLKVPMMPLYEFEILIGNSTKENWLGFWHDEQWLSNSDKHPHVNNMLRLARLDPERPLPIETSSIPEVLIEALAQADRPQAQDDALYRIARNMVWTPGLSQANRTFVEAFIDAHPQALNAKFGERLAYNGYSDLSTRLNRRIPAAMTAALRDGDPLRIKEILDLLEQQPTFYHAAIFDDLMAIFEAAANRRSLRRLPPVLAQVDGAGQKFVALLEKDLGWTAEDRTILAYGACIAGLEGITASRFAAVLRADLAADAKGIADVDVAVMISGLAHTGVKPGDIALLIDRYLVALETQPLMPPNVRLMIGLEDDSLLRTNHSWILHYANSGCTRLAS